MNENYSIENNIITIKVNKEIYSKEVIMQTTYVLLEKYYFFIDLDEKNNFIIQIRPKDTENLSKDDVLVFLDELIESSSYIDQLKRTSKTRQIILEKALLSQNLE